MGLKRFYIQKMARKVDGVLTEQQCYDTVSEWGMYCANEPYPLDSEAKELPSNDWGDEDGEDVWEPEGGVPLKAHDVTLLFYMKGGLEDVGTDLRRFVDYCTGKDGSGVLMKYYSEWTDNGHCGARFKKMDAPDYEITEWGVVTKVKVTFRVTEPHLMTSYDRDTNTINDKTW